ncbi:MAG: tetratricopeptide repeat protein [Arenimonas sp.]|nr:tetratricopeptide repeat protein [Arenimonas sp.]MBP7916996.1 tetratricopeptide repeat protein [Arenimonas sp.]
MTLFIVLAIAFVCLMLVLALRPLWREARPAALAAAALAMVLVGGLYYQFGRIDAIGYQPPSQEQEVANALTELEQLARQQPDNLEARVLLAKSMMQLGRFDAAQGYYTEALKLQPDNANLMVDYAESLFRAGKPDQPNAEAPQWIDKALVIDPQNQRALFFKGILLMQANQPAQAAAVWQQLLPQLDDSTAQALLPQINQARQQAGLPELAVAPAKSLQLVIDIDPTLKAQTPPGSVLFVSAKDPNRPGPPIAAKRIAVSEFPLTVTLSAADSIMPTAKLFSQAQFSVSARLSASGSVTAGKDDWLSAPVLVQSDKLEPVTLILHRQP